MGWNGRSWLLSDLLTEGTVLSLASVLYVLVAVGFLAGGVGYALGRDRATPVLVGAAVLSTIVPVAMWDGRFDLLVEKGIVGVAINVALVAPHAGEVRPANRSRRAGRVGERSAP